jgi:putative membrane protein
VNGFSLLFEVLASAGAGIVAGFATGLVPGLHMNNIAAALVAFSAASLAFFRLIGGALSAPDAGLLASCFICSALVAHQFSEALVSTYIGIPDGDVLSVLPAHRLARAGMGSSAIRSSADGSLAGVLIAMAAALPLCLVLGRPVRLYEVLASCMGVIVLAFSAGLVLSEVLPRARAARSGILAAHRLSFATAVFMSAGVLGTIVLRTDYFACPLPDFPWMHTDFVRRSSLLLPMFAGLFGLPNLLLSLASKSDCHRGVADADLMVHMPGKRDLALSLFGGTLVGWMPGMTSGSSASMCAVARGCSPEDDELGSSLGFIWLCSAIASAGAVFAVAAFFVISRERSGCMEAVGHFLGPMRSGSLLSEALPFACMLLSMSVASVASYRMLLFLVPRAARLRGLLCSKSLALAAICVVCSLILLLTGSRGSLLALTSTALGMVPISMGVRRIQLMGCLLVPIAISYFQGVD